MITHTFKNSSTLSLIDYRPETKTLTITFKSGGIYEFRDVPLDIISLFIATELKGESSGKFFHKNIKGKYLSERRDANWVIEQNSILHGWQAVKSVSNKQLALLYVQEQQNQGNTVQFRITEQKIK